MIVYGPREWVESCDTLDRLRAMAADPQLPWDPATRVDRAVATIVSAMAEIHGGEWRGQIDHQARVVLVVPY